MNYLIALNRHPTGSEWVKWITPLLLRGTENYDSEVKDALLDFYSTYPNASEEDLGIDEMVKQLGEWGFTNDKVHGLHLEFYRD